MNPGPIELGELKINPPLLLAPMAGISHTALRQLAGSLGPVGLYSTEMLAAKSMAGDHATSPLLVTTNSERPLSYQLLFNDPGQVEPAVEKVHGFGGNAIDVNFGCPAPTVRKRGGGSALMGDVGLAREIVSRCRRATTLPLTAKIRLGAKLDATALREFALMLEGEGVQMITVHARLIGEGYGRPPRWEWIGKVKEWVDVPVVANGSIFSGLDGTKCLALTGADGLMVGRGVAHRPWIFGELDRALRGLEPEPTPKLSELFRRFGDLLERHFRPERRLGRLKEFVFYFQTNFPFGHSLFSAVQGSNEFEHAMERAQEFFANNEEGFTGWNR